MKSLNDVLWNKDGEIGEEKGKNSEYQPMGEPPMLTDSCSCSYIVIECPANYGWQKMCN